MWKPTKKDKRSEAEKEVDEKITKLAKNAKDQSEIDSVLRTMKYRQELEELKKGPRLKPDTLVTAGVSIGSILLILFREELGNKIINSKALGFVLRGRV